MEFNYKLEYFCAIPPTYPPVLYKYRTWDNPLHRKVLTDGILYLASPKDFEDIKDCNVPEKFPQKEELYNLFLTKSKKENPNANRREHKLFAKEWSQKSPLGNPKRLRYLINQFNKEFNERFGVLSLTSNNCNGLMWAKYSDNNRGFCIGFDSKLLFESFNGGGGKIQYVDQLPVIDFINDNFVTKHIKNVFFKEKKWEFEQEFRLYKLWKDSLSINRNIKLPSDCIVEIIIGKMMSMKNKEEIYNIVKEKYPKCQLIESI